MVSLTRKLRAARLATIMTPLPWIESENLSQKKEEPF